MAVMVPFPAARRVALINSQARQMRQNRPEAAERILGNTIKRHRETLLRKGVADEIADHDTRSLEASIRAKLWEMVILGGGAA